MEFVTITGREESRPVFVWKRFVDEYPESRIHFRGLDNTEEKALKCDRFFRENDRFLHCLRIGRYLDFQLTD